MNVIPRLLALEVRVPPCGELHVESHNDIVDVLPCIHFGWITAQKPLQFDSLSCKLLRLRILHIILNQPTRLVGFQCCRQIIDS